MHPDSPKLLEDIRDAAAFVIDCARSETQQSYEANRLVRQAVERNFEIIGEALNRLSQIGALTAQSVGPIAQIKAFRNILIHAYDSIDHAIVWDVIQTKLPILLENVQELLASHEPDNTSSLLLYCASFHSREILKVATEDMGKPQSHQGHKKCAESIALVLFVSWWFSFVPRRAKSSAVPYPHPEAGTSPPHGRMSYNGIVSIKPSRCSRSSCWAACRIIRTRRGSAVCRAGAAVSRNRFDNRGAAS